RRACASRSRISIETRTCHAIRRCAGPSWCGNGSTCRATSRALAGACSGRARNDPMSTSMTREEIEHFLRNQRTLILSTLKKDGAPVSHALWFLYTGDAIYVNVQAKSFKYRNILRDDRVCALVEAGERYLDLRGVMVQGRASRVDDPAEQARVDAE